jgi:hypothetical protein
LRAIPVARFDVDANAGASLLVSGFVTEPGAYTL